MQIIHKIDHFLYSIFPNAIEGDESSLLNAVQTFYTYGPYKPKVRINEDLLIIEIDAPTILAQKSEYQTVVTLCEKGKFSEAKPMLLSLIEKNPTISEYHRIMGQILSEEGDHEEAINCLIDALRWDSKNGFALLMMANIFAKHKNDIDTAMRYYDQALVANPNDYITINNIAANLLQEGKWMEAKKYFLEAFKINKEYANIHFGLGLIAEIENEHQSAFSHFILAIKLNKNKDVLYQNSIKKAFELSKKIAVSEVGKNIVREYLHKLEFTGDRKIDIISDNDIPTAAKMEFAENYNRESHLVKYKPNYPAIEHLMMHELVHLDLVIEARKENLNQLFISTQQHKSAFIQSLEPSMKKLKKMGVPDKSISDYCSHLFDGLNSQIFNAPIDLFIEDFIYNKFEHLRPYQFLSLNNIVQEGLKAVTDKNIVELTPRDILSKSKVYNMVNALQFKELFGIDCINDYQASANELELSTSFYNEFLEYKVDKAPGEEYEMVLHWAEDLNLDKNFELVNELEYRNKRTNIENLISSIENDPYDVESNDPHKNREMEKFQSSQAELGLNMAVVMYMVEALNYFEGKPKDVIKEIAFDIATQGTQGFSPNKNNYRITAIKDKSFTGYQILAYYYVSWSLAIPEMVSELNLPYEAEYKMALNMNYPNK